MTKTNYNYENKVLSGSWIKCKQCNHILDINELTDLKECPSCGNYFRMTAQERINILTDDFKETNPFYRNIPQNTLDGYNDKLKKLDKNKENKSIVTGIGTINNHKVAIGVMDSHFFMGTLSLTLGDKLSALIKIATQKSIPLLLVTASGGARMQEGIIALMQMSRIVNQIKEFKNNNGFYISLLTDPTMGGVTASFASTANIQIGEQNAQVGFAGPRVIKKIRKEPLPSGFQTVNMMFKNGLLDDVVKRENIKDKLSTLLLLNERRK